MPAYDTAARHALSRALEECIRSEARPGTHDMEHSGTAAYDCSTVAAAHHDRSAALGILSRETSRPTPAPANVSARDPGASRQNAYDRATRPGPNAVVAETGARLVPLATDQLHMQSRSRRSGAAAELDVSRRLIRAMGMSPTRSSASGRSRRSLSRNALVAPPGRFDRTGGVGVSQNRASTRSSFRGMAGPWTCHSRRRGGRRPGRLRNWRRAGLSRSRPRDL